MRLMRHGIYWPAGYVWIFLCAVCLDARGQIYQCQDEHGKLAFSDRPCRGDQGQVVIPQKDPSRGTSDNHLRPLVASYCEQSIENARVWVHKMREERREKFESGKVSEIDYQEGIDILSRMEQKMTTRDCLSSHNKKRKFYECLNSTINTLERCISSHGAI